MKKEGSMCCTSALIPRRKHRGTHAKVINEKKKGKQTFTAGIPVSSSPGDEDGEKRGDWLRTHKRQEHLRSNPATKVWGGKRERTGPDMGRGRQPLFTKTWAKSYAKGGGQCRRVPKGKMQRGKVKNPPAPFLVSNNYPGGLQK